MERINFFIVTLLSLLLFYACEEEKIITEEDNSESKGIYESVERGPARIILETDKREMTIAERINLSITVDIEEDYEVDLPSFGDKLEQFGIVDYHRSQPELRDNNRKIVKRNYVLEPFLSGDYTVNPMKIAFYKSNDGESSKHFVETPKITVKVRSLLPADIKDMKLNEIVPPLPYPRSYRLWLWSAGGAAFIAILAGGLFIYRKRINRGQPVELRLKAHEIAYNELKKLVSEDLVGKGDVKQFYLRLSAIVRRYIENRFGLRAPEQTTEEFLNGLERTQDFPSEYKPLLKTFLRHSDLVKFAKFEPDTGDIQKSFDSCKAFISGTEEQD